MSVVVPDEILTATHMTEAEMRQEIAVMLFQREKLTLAQASRFADMHRVAFQHLLASRQIPAIADLVGCVATSKRIITPIAHPAQT